MNIQQAQKLQAYKNKWVALLNNKVIADGKSLKEVQQKVLRKKMSQECIFHLVPERQLALYGSAL